MVNQLIDPDSVTGKDNRQLANAINHSPRVHAQGPWGHAEAARRHFP